MGVDLEAIARRIRHLVKLADNDSEHEGSLAEYLADQALDIADALDRLIELERRTLGHLRGEQRRVRRIEELAVALDQIVNAWPIPSDGFTAALARGRAVLASEENR